MSKRDALIEKYTEHLTDKVKVKVDKALLLAVTKACGPSIYNKDSATVAASSKSELETVKKSFLIKKLGLKDGPKLDEGLAAVMKQYGSGCAQQVSRGCLLPAGQALPQRRRLQVGKT